MKTSPSQHLAVVACIVSIAAFYMILSGVDPTVDKRNRHYPPILWGYDADESDCSDSSDNDGDGDIDCEDADCASDDICRESETNCTNSVDDDSDGDIDCEDADCSADPSCA
jgi:hypothetical protein